MKNSNIKGFTLIELSIASIIIGLFLVGLIKVYEQHLIEKRKAEFVQKTDSITSAFAYYLQDEGLALDINETPIPDNPATAGVDESRDPTRYPCPASPLFGPDDADYGVEQRNLDTGTCLSTPTNGVIARGTGTNRVYIGSIPTATLGVSSRFIFDPYSRRFTYAVSERVSQSNPTATAPGGSMGGGNNPPGAITVQQLDVFGNIISTNTNVPFAIIAHGENGIGAFNIQGNLYKDCAAPYTGRDRMNCDNDNNNIFVDSNGSRVFHTENAAEYDDTIIFSLRGVADKEEYWGMGLDSTNLIALNTGRVGIGTATPAEKLDVNGRVRAHTFLHASDQRLKKNIEPFSKKALEKIKAIEVVTYDYIDHKEEHKKIGVIAQDLEKIYPELVFTGEDDYLTVDYVSLTGPIIKGLQELSIEKDREILELRTELSNALRRIEAIEKKEEKNLNLDKTGEILNE